MRRASVLLCILAYVGSGTASADQRQADRGWRMVGLCGSFAYGAMAPDSLDRSYSSFVGSVEIPIAFGISELHGLGFGITPFEMRYGMADKEGESEISAGLPTSWAALYVYYPLVMSEKKWLSRHVRDVRSHALLVFAGGSRWAWDDHDYIHTDLKYVHSVGLGSAPSRGTELGMLGIQAGTAPWSRRSRHGVDESPERGWYGWYVGVFAGIGSLAE